MTSPATLQEIPFALVQLGQQLAEPGTIAAYPEALGSAAAIVQDLNGSAIFDLPQPSPERPRVNLQLASGDVCDAEVSLQVRVQEALNQEALRRIMARLAIAVPAPGPPDRAASGERHALALTI